MKSLPKRSRSQYQLRHTIGLILGVIMALIAMVLINSSVADPHWVDEDNEPAGIHFPELGKKVSNKINWFTSSR